MKLGVSLRIEWLGLWDDLGLSRFEYFEVVPYVSIDQQGLLQELMRRTAKSQVFLHLTNVNACDDHDYFRKDTEHVVAMAKAANVAGVSLHFGVGVFEGTRFANVLPAPPTVAMRERARQNIAFLKSQINVPVSLEHLSLTTPLVTPEAYYEAYLAAATDNGCELLVDFSNLWATEKNFARTAERVSATKDLKIAYMHWGGSYLGGEGKYYDTHHTFTYDPEVLSVASAHERPLILEFDGGLSDLESCRDNLNRFISAFPQ